MKAIDYYNKYTDIVVYYKIGNKEQLTRVLKELLDEMLEESVSMVKSRGIKTTEGLFAVYKEQNKKWNALVNIYIKNNSFSPIKENAFKIWIAHVAPEYKNLI